jgi:tRNA A-37 threonylcarbamoyl transferase component Bud32
VDVRRTNAGDAAAETLAGTGAPSGEYEGESSLAREIRAALGDASQTPPTVGRFELLSELGEGGMGTVYLGRDPRLDRMVAVKLVKSERITSEARRRLEREAQALAQLSHPNVVAVFEVGEERGQTFLAMERIVGQDLKQWLQSSKRDYREILDVFIQAGRGLAAAHAQGLVHRDFKPSNALVGDDGRVRVVDFGLAKEELAAVESGSESTLHQGSVTRTGRFVGTPAYMSPEQLGDRHVGPASDQFSLCVTLFEALTGRRPFGEGAVEVVAARVISGRPDPLPDGSYPEELAEVLRRGLSREPSQRFADMNELLVVLEGLRAPRRPGGWLWAMGGLVVGATIAAIYTSSDTALQAEAGMVQLGDFERSFDIPVVAPDGGPADILDPMAGSDDSMQAKLISASRAFADGNYEHSVRLFDEIAGPFERMNRFGSAVARLQLMRGIAYLRLAEIEKDRRRTVIALELLRRAVENDYRHPRPDEIRPAAERELQRLLDNPQLGASDFADERVALATFFNHEPGTRVYVTEGPKNPYAHDAEFACAEPCCVPFTVREPTHVTFRRAGYHDGVLMWAPGRFDMLPVIPRPLVPLADVEPVP